jgi:hypothetical protein
MTYHILTTKYLEHILDSNTSQIIKIILESNKKLRSHNGIVKSNIKCKTSNPYEIIQFIENTVQFGFNVFMNDYTHNISNTINLIILRSSIIEVIMTNINLDNIPQYFKYVTKIILKTIITNSIELTLNYFNHYHGFFCETFVNYLNYTKIFYYKNGKIIINPKYIIRKYIKYVTEPIPIMDYFNIHNDYHHLTDVTLEDIIYNPSLLQKLDDIEIDEDSSNSNPHRISNECYILIKKNITSFDKNEYKKSLTLYDILFNHIIR